jgi:putative iron-regulated protein
MLIINISFYRLFFMFMFVHCFKVSATFIFVVLICVACDQKHDTTKDSTSSAESPLLAASALPPKLDVETADDLADSLWLKSQEYLDTTYARANDLQKAISRLLANPDASSLLFAQQQWHSTMAAYEKLSPLLYLEHQQTQPNTGLDKDNRGQKDKKDTALVAINLGTDTLVGGKNTINNLLDVEESRNKIAAWPIQPGYLDSYGSHTHSGIVNDITLLIEPHTIRSQHLITDREEVTLGIYAIEYLLFGDKDYKNKKDTRFTRFINVSKLPKALAQAGLLIDELPNNRRRALIELQSRLLVNDINRLISLYQTNGALTTAFNNLSADEKLGAFKRSVVHSLQKSRTLLTYFNEYLSSAKGIATSASDTSASTDQNSDQNNTQHTIDSADTDAFSRRFIINRTLALNINLATIKPLFSNADVSPEFAKKLGQETSGQTIDTPTLGTAVLTDENKKRVADLLEDIEKELAKSDYSVEGVADKLKALASTLSI